MLQPALLNNQQNRGLPAIGVGLRHPHFSDALANTASIDFVELHSENFFAEGGASHAVMEAIIAKYPVSLHSTAMGLGSAQSMPQKYQRKLAKLVNWVNPALLSDHACYSWSDIGGTPVHAGDLLPLAFSQKSLSVLVENVDRVQQLLGRQILVENLSAYMQLKSTMAETTFLIQLTQLTGCGLLVDLNNILVSAHNLAEPDPLAYAKQWLASIPAKSVGELHLAGVSAGSDDELIIDDHSQPVSDICWQLYAYALGRFGTVPTLIEWDNDLPSWQRLLQEAEQAQKIAETVFTSKHDSNVLQAQQGGTR